MTNTALLALLVTAAGLWIALAVDASGQAFRLGRRHARRVKLSKRFSRRPTL